jgi:hypothetical protein
MDTDDIRVHEDTNGVSWSSVGGLTKVVLIALALLIVGEIYSLARITSLGRSLKTQDAARKELVAQFNEQLSSRLTAFQQADQAQLEVLKAEMDQTSRHVGAQRGELRRDRAMVSKLQSEHNKQLNDLKHEIALKADQQQLGALTADVSNTKSDLSKTQKNVQELVNSFGMTRSRFGTLIARNHDEIDALRKLGQRDYYEFTLVRHHPIHLANIGMDLKKTNKKHHRFTVDLLVDDVWIEKDHRTIDEPIFFATRGTRTFCELVVNKVDKGVITGYISTPKGLTQMASRAGGTR